MRPTSGWRIGVLTGIALALLAVTAALSNALLFRQDVQGNSHNTSHISTVLGPWVQVEDIGPSLGEIHGLETTDIIKRVYANGPHTIELVVAYIPHSSRKSAHAQEACLRGSGAQVGSIAMRQLAHSPVLAKSISLNLHGRRDQVYYWYKVGHIYTADYLSTSFKLFLGRLTGHAYHGASLIRLLTPVSDGESPAAVNRRLENFTRYLLPELSRAVP